MYPPGVGLRAEDSILEQLASQVRETLTQRKADGVVGDDIALERDLLALGTTSRRSIKTVFLGSHGAKIIRHSPVPVLVLPS